MDPRPFRDFAEGGTRDSAKAGYVKKQRLDQLVVDRGLAPTRSKAQALILAGSVTVLGKRVDKVGTLVPADAEVQCTEQRCPFVSRGGQKLDSALATLGVEVAGKTALDVGASTGGFSDCLLQRGAARVFAVDVGYGQLAHKLRVDPRVVVMERTNARALTPAALDGPVDLTVVDASFIGLGALAEALASCTRVGGELVALIKPQFEAGRKEVSRGRGVIRDDEVRGAAIASAIASILPHGFVELGRCDCAVPGPKGNVEAFLHARRVAIPAFLG